MKHAPIIYQITAGRRSITLFSDLRIQIKGPRLNQWVFPAASLAKALAAVDAFAYEYPRAKWRIVVDTTDKTPASR